MSSMLKSKELQVPCKIETYQPFKRTVKIYCSVIFISCFHKRRLQHRSGIQNWGEALKQMDLELISLSVCTSKCTYKLSRICIFSVSTIFFDTLASFSLSLFLLPWPKFTLENFTLQNAIKLKPPLAIHPCANSTSRGLLYFAPAFSFTC